MSEQEMLDRIAELEEAVKMLNELWTQEYKQHGETKMKLIKFQKIVLGIEE